MFLCVCVFVCVCVCKMEHEGPTKLVPIERRDFQTIERETMTILEHGEGEKSGGSSRSLICSGERFT